MHFFKLFIKLCFLLLITSTVAYGQNTYWWGSGENYRIRSIDLRYVDFRLSNPDYMYFVTDRPYFRLNKEMRINNGQIGSWGSSTDLQLRTNGVERMRVRISNGFVGINNTSPSHHLQIHGTSDYIVSNLPVLIDEPDGNNSSEFTSKSTTNYGKAGRLSLTNSDTGSGAQSGGLLMQNGNNLNIWNQEGGILNISSSGVSLKLYGANKRTLLGAGLSMSSSKYALSTIHSPTDNGMYIQTNTANKYGLSIQVREDHSTVLESTYAGETEPHFKVTGGGEVYARKYITTLNPFPDYVFSEDYELMSYQDLRNYIYTNKHLPNIPKATTVEENGMDLGELNRILVEKVEELTLYILELEDRLSEIEKEESSTNAEENTLVERINKLEALIEKLNK